MIDTGRFHVRPLHCDAMGHLNARAYAAIFDDAGPHLMLAVGYDRERYIAEAIGWADVEQTIRYLREVHDGALLSVSSTVTKISTKALHYRHVIADAASGEAVATMDGAMVCFDLEQRRARAIPQAIRDACEALIDAPAEQ